MELTLALVLGLAAVAASLLIWGQTQGVFKIFGDTLVIEDQTPLTLDRPRRVVTEQAVTESFETLLLFDRAASTAFWNHESGEATLPAGVAEGIVQSKTMSHLTGAVMVVSLETTADQPIGSHIYSAISADGGTTWTPLVTGTAVRFEDLTETDWRWRMLLMRGTASRNPSIQDLTINFTVQP
ncbi:hypothetical protein HY523_01370 [Candidatus Berkelbacteria bacterium]|nr:hypothetical protein [Candidatus Berkelbacteria bacterium]